MKLIMVLMTILVSSAFAGENKYVVSMASCESSEKYFEIYFTHTEADINTNEAFIAVKTKSTPPARGIKYLVQDVEMKSVYNTHNVPCETLINYSVIKTQTKISINFCENKHHVEETYSGQRTVSKVECKFI